MKKTFLLFVLIISISIYSQKDKVKKDYLTYGLSVSGKNHYQNLLFSKYGFKSIAVAGCLVSKKLIDSVKTNNNLLWKEVDSIYGINTSKKIKNTKRLITRFLIQHSSKIEKNKKIRKIYKQYKKNGDYDGIMALQEITLEKIIYIIEGVSKKDSNKKSSSIYKAFFNLKTDELDILKI